MKLYFLPSPVQWEPERYHYAVEQMMLMLFPGERPEYPAEKPGGQEDNCAIFGLDVMENTAVLLVELTRGGQEESGGFMFPAAELELPSEQRYHTVQHALKMAFYQAGTLLLGQEPPWGALTGVRPVKLPARAMLAGASPEEAQRELESEYCVSPTRAALAVDCARASVAARRSLKPDEVSLYIGIPFCPSRCAYCSFVSADVGRTLHLVEPYLEGLLQEVEETGRLLKELGLSVRSFYMGGGTPTVLSPEQLARLLARCEDCLPLESCTEYTVEAGRPDTVTEEKLAVLKGHGIRRVSINPQTLVPRVLEAIGRLHTAGDFRRAYELARAVGFDCVNTDLIAGLPRDSFEGFCHTLEEVAAMGPENITVHTLALKKGSKLGAPGKGGALVGERTGGGMSEPSRLRGGERYRAREDEVEGENAGALPDGDEVALMLDVSRELLAQLDYRPYYLYRQKYMSGSLENVGWARPGTESLYNIVMMEELHTVISLGAGGVTKLIRGGDIRRLTNPKYPQDYLSGLDKVLAQKEEIRKFYL